MVNFVSPMDPCLPHSHNPLQSLLFGLMQFNHKIIYLLYDLDIFHLDELLAEIMLCQIQVIQLFQLLDHFGLGE